MGIKSLCLFFGLRFCLFPSPPISLLLGRRSESEELKVDRLPSNQPNLSFSLNKRKLDVQFSAIATHPS
jgi:hypothetical protein